MDVIYLDCAKAFDKVPHKRLAKNYKHVELEGRPLLGLKGGYMVEGKRWVGPIGEKHSSPPPLVLGV